MIEFALEAESGIPLYRQIIDQIKYAVAAGQLAAGDKLPTVRRLAVDLSINPNTVAKAYNELELTGHVDSQQGTGTFIAEKKIEITKIERRRKLAEIAQRFISEAASYGFGVEDIVDNLSERRTGDEQ